MNEHQNDLIARGLARSYRGRLIPVMRGGDHDEALPFAEIVADSPFSEYADIPEDLTSLSDADLMQLHADLETTISEVAGNPAEFIAGDMTTARLLDVTRAASEKRNELAAAIKERQSVSEEDTAAFAGLAATPEDAAAAETAELANEGDDEGDEGDEGGDGDGGDETAANESVTAGGNGTQFSRRRARPTSDRQMLETQEHEQTLPLVASGGCRDIDPGTPFGSDIELAEAMCSRHDSITRGDGMQSGPFEKFGIAKANWKADYASDRKLVKDEEANWATIKALVNDLDIRRAFNERMHEQDKAMAITASGGLCAPVTPYYNLQYISVPTRPVMAALPSFQADRGGLRYARPAALSAVTTAVGLLTAVEDGEGGSAATKTCQVIPCPAFTETDVDIIFHCLQFGNLGARAFPELVAQWNNLVLAAHARVAESNLLTQIDSFSTQVTASSLGLGASGALLGQILTAADGLRSRNRMDPMAVLRVILPWWSVDLLVSDVIRGQFQRFDTDQGRITALLRSFNIEPTFHIDGGNGRGQVYATQTAAALLPFPAEVVWYIFPEGSFLYLDGGTLELGIVRDSVLNKTNDFQIFGETFENVAFIGVESLAVASTICDTGAVSLPVTVSTCTYS